MNRRRFLHSAVAGVALPSIAHAHAPTDVGFASDVVWFVDQLAARYAYLSDRHLDLARLRALHLPAAAAAVDRRAFLPVLERVVAELYDDHVTINSNNDQSPQLVPTGTDLWGEMRGGQAFVTAVRPGSAAERAGLRAGDELLTIANQPVAAFVADRRPRSLTVPDPEANNFTLRAGLAGNRTDDRAFEVLTPAGAQKAVVLPPFEPAPEGPLLSTIDLGDRLAAIRIGNSLGDSDLVAAFDAALASVRSSRGLILDLRNTPSGGNSDIAEPILGRFIRGERGYQRVFTPGSGRQFPKDSWVKQVRGRGDFTYEADLVVLCDRWTGSMGEGMVIGLDAMNRSTTVGTRMAGLCGGTEGSKLPKSGYSVHVPVEKLYHVDGTPRERWAPAELVDLTNATEADPILTRGVDVLRSRTNGR